MVLFGGELILVLNRIWYGNRKMKIRTDMLSACDFGGSWHLVEAVFIMDRIYIMCGVFQPGGSSYLYRQTSNLRSLEDILRISFEMILLTL